MPAVRPDQNLTDERLRCFASGVETAQQLDAAIENSRHMLDILQSGADPHSSTSFQTEAANYSLHIGAFEEGIRQAEACGEVGIELSWIGEFRRLEGLIRKAPTNESDAHGQFDALDSVKDWLRRDMAGIPEPQPRPSPEYICRTCNRGFVTERGAERHQEENPSHVVGAITV